VHPSFKINNIAFTEQSFIGFIDDLLISNEDYLKDIGQFLNEWNNDNDYIVVKTSGSTGKPKEIKLLKEHMRNSALATSSFFNLKENSTVLLCLSATYIAGKMMLVRALVSGWNIYLKAPSSNPLEDDTTYDFAAMVPMQVTNSLDKLQNIKQLIIGGAPVSQNLQEQLYEITTQCYVTYGMTETCTHIAVKSLDANAKDVYKVLPNVVISQDDRECLMISAPDISNELIVTNDIVKIVSDTEFMWLGRFDSIINSGGVKLFPEQIERKLSGVIKERFFVAGIPDDILGERLILIIESDANDLYSRNELAKLLLKYEVPKNIYYITKFKETPTGKVHRLNTLNIVSV
jgi:O-succinylbenzoic acid--CoA ligase